MTGNDVNYWGVDCIELKDNFEVQPGAEFLADFKPYGKEAHRWLVKDHKQNVRTLLDDEGAVIDHIDYYPFNLRWDYNDSPAYDRNLKGAVEQVGIAKHIDVMGYRTCDRTTGRFMNVDPLASDMPSWSPYNYTFNNPIRFTDPEGLSPDDIILRGSNNSSITIKTDLVDIDVNAGGIVGDLGGNYTFEGDDILVAGLDIAGVVDPTGVADVAAAGIEAKNGNYGMAALSALGVIPYVGDLGKVGKIGKHTKTIKKVISETKAGKGNITSKSVLTESQALDAGIDFVGGNARELGKNGSGVFRSQTKNADGTVNQFRMDSGSIQGNHNPNVPHVHLEVVKPNNKVRVNNHIPIKKN